MVKFSVKIGRLCRTSLPSQQSVCPITNVWRLIIASLHTDYVGYHHILMMILTVVVVLGDKALATLYTSVPPGTDKQKPSYSQAAIRIVVAWRMYISFRYRTPQKAPIWRSEQAIFVSAFRMAVRTHGGVGAEGMTSRRVRS